MAAVDEGWSHRVARQDVPEEGLHVNLEGDQAVRAALAKTAGLRDLPRLQASFDLTRRPDDAIHVTGEVSATVVQDCVVTLEPIEQNLLEAIDLVFVPQAADQGQGPDVNLGEGEPPETMAGGTVDLGAIATEYFLLGVDPYPRKAGAEFKSASAGGPAESPFAALAALKKPDPGKT